MLSTTPGSRCRSSTRLHRSTSSRIEKVELRYPSGKHNREEHAKRAKLLAQTTERRAGTSTNPYRYASCSFSFGNAF